MTSVLKLDKLQTPSGQQLMTFGAGGLVDFDGSYQPQGFNFPSWNGAGERPANPVIGTTGVNTAFEDAVIDVYLGIHPISGEPSWLSVNTGSKAPGT